MEITINPEQRLFCIPAGTDGFSTAGFDYVYKQLKGLSQKLSSFGIDVGLVNPNEIGTVEQYNQYSRASSLIGTRDLGTWFDPDTPRRVQSILERYRKSGEKIRLFYGDTRTGRDWLQEWNVMGHIGRSIGPMKIPLLIPDNEMWGDGILDNCIVRLIDVATHQELYRHPRYHMEPIQIQTLNGFDKFNHAVLVSGKIQARFASFGKAAQWVAFMDGECMEQPT